MFKKITSLLVFLFLLVQPLASFAAMSSASFNIYADSVDTGGVLGTSTSYALQDTVSEPISDTATSSSYIVRGGYQGSDLGSLSMSISSASVSLGTLSQTAVSSASTGVTINSENFSYPTGYTLSIGSVSGTSIAAVTDGSVTAGSEEYGFSVVGTDRVFSDDEGATAGRVISYTNSTAANSLSTLTFKASISSASTAATYSQSVVLSASANI